ARSNAKQLFCTFNRNGLVLPYIKKNMAHNTPVKSKRYRYPLLALLVLTALLKPCAASEGKNGQATWTRSNFYEIALRQNKIQYKSSSDSDSFRERSWEVTSKTSDNEGNIQWNHFKKKEEKPLKKFKMEGRKDLKAKICMITYHKNREKSSLVLLVQGKVITIYNVEKTKLEQVYTEPFKEGLKVESDWFGKIIFSGQNLIEPQRFALVYDKTTQTFQGSAWALSIKDTAITIIVNLAGISFVWYILKELISKQQD
ncbi:MAG: hypothetical protein ACPGC9_00830, partial [Cytophagales bacterium]